MDRARGDDVSVVGEGARVEGVLTSAGSLWIHGHVTGEIAVEGEVLVFPESVVEADIRAGSISLAGRLKGNLMAPGAVSLPPESWVEGDVHARSVAVRGTVDGWPRTRWSLVRKRLSAETSCAGPSSSPPAQSSAAART